MNCLNGECSAEVPAHVRNCVVCGTDAGCPNVRSSKAVVSLPLSRVNELVSSDNSLYCTYYQGVDADSRLPESNEWDSVRQSVDALVFPYYFKEIRFGALTLDGRRIWALTIVDNFSRVSPAIWVGQQARATDVVDTLNRATAEFGCPGRIRVDNGSKFTSKELDLWAYANGVILDFSRPGKSTDNAFIEAFNSRFRWECLNQHWFLDLQDATMKINAWRQDYNQVRSHGAIDNRVPMDLLKPTHQPWLMGPDNRISDILSGPSSG